MRALLIAFLTLCVITPTRARADDSHSPGGPSSDISAQDREWAELGARLQRKANRAAFTYKVTGIVELSLGAVVVGAGQLGISGSDPDALVGSTFHRMFQGATVIGGIGMVIGAGLLLHTPDHVRAYRKFERLDALRKAKAGDPSASLAITVRAERERHARSIRRTLGIGALVLGVAGSAVTALYHDELGDYSVLAGTLAGAGVGSGTLLVVNAWAPTEMENARGELGRAPVIVPQRGGAMALYGVSF